MEDTNISKFVDSVTDYIWETIDKANSLKEEKAQLTQEQADALYKAATYFMRTVGELTEGKTIFTTSSKKLTAVLSGF